MLVLDGGSKVRGRLGKFEGHGCRQPGEINRLDFGACPVTPTAGLASEKVQIENRKAIMTGSKTPGFQAEHEEPSVTIHAIDCASREGAEFTFELDGSHLTIALGGRKFDLGIVDEEDKRKLMNLLADWPDWQDSP